MCCLSWHWRYWSFLSYPTSFCNCFQGADLGFPTQPGRRPRLQNKLITMRMSPESLILAIAHTRVYVATSVVTMFRGALHRRISNCWQRCWHVLKTMSMQKGEIKLMFVIEGHGTRSLKLKTISDIMLTKSCGQNWRIQSWTFEAGGCAEDVVLVIWSGICLLESMMLMLRTIHNLYTLRFLFPHLILWSDGKSSLRHNYDTDVPRPCPFFIIVGWSSLILDCSYLR